MDVLVYIGIGIFISAIIFDGSSNIWEVPTIIFWPIAIPLFILITIIRLFIELGMVLYDSLIGGRG